MSSELEPDRSDVRGRLVEEAARILGEEGPSALSARRIAAGAGTSTMAVYTHFGAMSAVVDEVATEGFRRLIAHVDAVGRSDDTLADLRASAAAYRENALENRHLFGVMFGAVGRGDLHGSGPNPEVALAAFDQIAGLVERAMTAGTLLPDDPRQVAAQFWSALHGYVMLELSGVVRIVDDPEHAVLWPMLTHLLRGLAPSSD
ncbi:TetR/AcrR family transcriptional regulator [Nocardioides currus]|uniref:TetR/AcrR family transcriptional regulator n=1 Tax=Nocardioides currus TaxID=2133958 RepID=UPI001403B8FC|nr:TetR/AcrR family transcriptional regulator [Nocardioides currus]